jgi:hypothetical protein
VSFTVVDLPDLGAIPKNNGDANTAQVATALTQSFNEEIAKAVARALPDDDDDDGGGGAAGCFIYGLRP